MFELESCTPKPFERILASDCKATWYYVETIKKIGRKEERKKERKKCATNAKIIWELGII